MIVMPSHPRRFPPYRVHWNWDISFKCNYACSYCEVIKRDEEFSYQPIEIAQWRDIWAGIFERYWSTHIRFSGGEPTIYPGFFDLVAMLLEKNTVDITTNMSFDLKSFLDVIPPNRGLSISASFHPEFSDFTTVFDKVKYLHRHGFPATISYVGYPAHLDRIYEYKKIVEAEHMYFKIIPFSGLLNGHRYPDAYSPAEKILLEGIARDSIDQHLSDMNSRWYDWRVKKNDDNPSSKIKTGNLCRMGEMYAKIHPDGSVTRCCAGHHGIDAGVLGNITDPAFRLLDEAQPCQVAYQCPCFKCMTVGQEEEIWVPLWESLEHPVYKTEFARECACRYADASGKPVAVTQGND